MTAPILRIFWLCGLLLAPALWVLLIMLQIIAEVMG